MRGVQQSCRSFKQELSYFANELVFCMHRITSYTYVRAIRFVRESKFHVFEEFFPPYSSLALPQCTNIRTIITRFERCFYDLMVLMYNNELFDLFSIPNLNMFQQIVLQSLGYISLPLALKIEPSKEWPNWLYKVISVLISKVK